MVWGRYRRTRKLGSREIGNIDVALFLRISMFSSLIVIALVYVSIDLWLPLPPPALIRCPLHLKARYRGYRLLMVSSCP